MPLMATDDNEYSQIQSDDILYRPHTHISLTCWSTDSCSRSQWTV